MMQHKGDSECGPGVAARARRVCGFEKSDSALHWPVPSRPELPAAELRPQRAEGGLVQEQQLGVNPFKLGLDRQHRHAQRDAGARARGRLRQGHLGPRATTANRSCSCTTGVTRRHRGHPRRPGRALGGGELARRAVRRDAPARAYTHQRHAPDRALLRRRDARAACGDPDFVERAYTPACRWAATSAPATESPRFAVLAVRDPGDDASAPGTPLQRVQIVKGWVDAAGQTHEKVFDVAGNANNGATVDTHTCARPAGRRFALRRLGGSRLHAQPARLLLRPRLLENPICRWSTCLCNAQGVDCSKPESVPSEYATCCNPAVSEDHPGARLVVTDLVPPRGHRRAHGNNSVRHHGRHGRAHAQRDNR